MRRSTMEGVAATPPVQQSTLSYRSSWPPRTKPSVSWPRRAGRANPLPRFTGIGPGSLAEGSASGGARAAGRVVGPGPHPVVCRGCNCSVGSMQGPKEGGGGAPPFRGQACAKPLGRAEVEDGSGEDDPEAWGRAGRRVRRPSPGQLGVRPGRRLLGVVHGGPARSLEGQSTRMRPISRFRGGGFVLRLGLT